MRNLLVDMDGVLLDIYHQFLKFEERETGSRQGSEALKGKLELEAFPDGVRYLNTPGFFREAPPMEGSVSGLKMLDNKYHVLVVSLATEYPGTIPEKIEWLNRNFPFLSWKQMVFCGDKSMIRGDILVDDHAKNLDHFDGERILYTQPHNINYTPRRGQRVNCWDELVSLL